MDRNQRSRNQKKSVPPRKGQPSHRNTKSAPPQRSSRPAAAQSWGSVHASSDRASPRLSVCATAPRAASKYGGQL